MSEFPASSGNIHEMVRALVAVALANMAVLKNVDINDTLRDYLTGSVLDHMHPDHVHGIAERDPSGVAALAREINAQLDAVVVVRMRDMIARMEGKNDLNDPRVVALSNEIADTFVASLANRQNVRWENPYSLVLQHYADKPRGPTTGVREDGTICTRWWLGIEFHRDPKEGPANIEENGARRLEEYYVEGKLHRPHEDGPAMIYTHYEDFDLSGEEYFERGVRHRPGELGPAVTHWDRAGNVMMEAYYENGKQHRDPRLGPAWFYVHNATTTKEEPENTTEIKYAVHGTLHRDEQDGPAVLARDNASGVVVCEEYWRNGIQHRDGGPAIIWRTSDGKELGEHWYRGGQLHRAPGEGPAAIWRGDDYIFEQWYADGRLHRDPAEGPAVINHDLEAGTRRQEFWVAGERYPAQGPASVKRGQDGKVIEELFWDGEQLVPAAFSQNREAAAHG